jgi:uncharacterized protein YcbK (DUF882 family)
MFGLKPQILKNIVTAIIVGVTITLILAYRFHIYFAILRLFTPRTSKAENNEKIKELHPTFAIKIARYIKQLEKDGHSVEITSGFRDVEKQSELYANGDTDTLPGNSFHNYGLAVDLNIDSAKMGTGKAGWEKFASIGKVAYNMRWGGDFNDYDPVHFDEGNKYSTEELKTMLENKEVVNSKYVKIF